MKSILLTACLLFTFILSQAQTPIIFQPGPGLNDGTDEGGINGGKDCFIYTGGLDTLTHYSEGYMLVYPKSNCNLTTVISLIQFNLDSLPTNIDSVKLVLTHTDPAPYCYSNCVADFHIARNLAPWSETTVSYSNPPAIDSPIYTIHNLNWKDTLGVREYDITTSYNLWKSGVLPNYGLTFYSNSIGCNNAAVHFNSYTSDDTAIARRPYLKIYEHEIPNQVNDFATQIQFNIYPNPTNERVTISYHNNDEQQSKFEIYDITQKLVSTNSWDNHQINFQKNIDIHHLTPGIYIYNLQIGNNSLRGKLIKK